jgi:hypothetical protein
MAIGNANITAGHTYNGGDILTETNLNALGLPTVAIAFSGDTNTGLSNPSADVIGVEAGGTEIIRFSISGIQAKYGIFRDIDTSVLTLTGGTVGSGANIELYGGTHASLANDANFDADQVNFRSQNAATTYARVGATGLTLGSTGNAIKAIWHDQLGMTVTIGGDSVLNLPCTITGAAVGDIVHVCWSNQGDSPITSISLSGYVISANTVRVLLHNHDSGAAIVNEYVKVMVLDIT